MIVVVAKSATQRQTKLVQRGRRKRQDRGRSTSMASASPPSSSPSPPDAASRPERFCTVVPASGSSKRTVYIHPKLQPQPKRGTEPGLSYKIISMKFSSPDLEPWNLKGIEFLFWETLRFSHCDG